MNKKNRKASHTSGSQTKKVNLAQHLLQQATNNSNINQINHLLQQGIVLHRQGKLSEANHCYQETLKLQPDHADALNLSGVLAAKRGETEAAISLIQRSLQFNPANVFAMNNLASALREAGRSSDAIHYLQKAIKLKPDYTDALCTLGKIYSDLNNLEQAELHYKSAIELKPDMPEAWDNLALLYRKLRRFELALGCAKQALVLQENNAELHNSLGNIYRDLGDKSAALKSYQRACEINPNLANAQHFVQVLSGLTSEKAPANYVSKVFDNYADNFDHHLTQVLHYQMPQLIGQTLRKIYQNSPGFWRILDLGCGTGMVGQELTGVNCELIGVDLSAKMLDKAKAKNIYHQLIQADILDVLIQQQGQCMQIVVAADVFVYLGKLDEIFAQVARVLIPSGLFCFSLEALADNTNELGYQLQLSGRYAHQLNYIQRLAQLHHLQIAQCTSQTLRTENNQNIQGYLVYLQKQQ